VYIAKVARSQFGCLSSEPGGSAAGSDAQIGAANTKSSIRTGLMRTQISYPYRKEHWVNGALKGVRSDSAMRQLSSLIPASIRQVNATH
jgi:hypothetical protein